MNLQDTILHLADTHLVLAQRNAEWCGHGPVLEQDIAITNISLDLLGQARLFYQYAAKLTQDASITEDHLAYFRGEREFKNHLLCELPKGDWAQTLLRQFLFSNFQIQLFSFLLNHSDKELAAIAEKSLKETRYHLRWSSEWVIRLGDGTEESHQRMKNAIETLWRYHDELYTPADFELVSGIDVAAFKDAAMANVQNVFKEATLEIPQNVFAQSGGKTGMHTEYLGYLLAEMQILPRTYPDATW